MSELPRLSYSGAEALKALAAAAIDPGELTREELSSRIQVPLGSGLSKVVNRLVHDGLVTEDGDAVVLTDLGVACCHAKGYRCAERT